MDCGGDGIGGSVTGLGIDRRGGCTYKTDVQTPRYLLDSRDKALDV